MSELTENQVLAVTRSLTVRQVIDINRLIDLGRISGPKLSTENFDLSRCAVCGEVFVVGEEGDARAEKDYCQHHTYTRP